MLSRTATVSASKASKEAIKRICILSPMTTEHQVIHLNAGKNTIGRNKETGIRDVRCSKNQLELNVNCECHRIRLKVTGVNPSSVNGLMIMQHAECDLEHGDVLEIVYGRYPFEVVFKPAPEMPVVSLKGHDELVIDERNCMESWDSVENGKMIIYTSANVISSSKIAGYDMDGTIIKTKSGNVFPKTTDDWQLNYADEVTKKLKSLFANGYKICFFTNQGGIARGKVNVNDFKRKVQNIVKKLNVPVQVFIAIANDYYRKPLPGMWEYLRKEKNDGVALDLDKCFFVGDAAGRPEVGSGHSKRRKDHSLADRLFAKNIKISFYTPEEHFLRKRIEDWTAPEFDPECLQYGLPQFQPSDTKIPFDGVEMILMVGLPGSGKSYFTQNYLSKYNYFVANADTLGSVKACLTACENALAKGKSCVVDNTNVDVESRKKFIDIAKKLNTSSRCFEMNVQLAQIRHNIAFRELTDTSHSKINDMIFNGMKKKYKTPTLDEGFQSIVKVNLIPKFNSEEQRQLYQLYLLEK